MGAETVTSLAAGEASTLEDGSRGRVRLAAGSLWHEADPDSKLYVNLYIPSTLDWREKGFTIEQATQYPFKGSSLLTVRGNGPLAVMLRDSRSRRSWDPSRMRRTVGPSEESGMPPTSSLFKCHAARKAVGSAWEADKACPAQLR